MGERKERWLKEQRERKFKKDRKEFAKQKKNRRKHTTWADMINERRKRRKL